MHNHYHRHYTHYLRAVPPAARAVRALEICLPRPENSSLKLLIDKQLITSDPQPKDPEKADITYVRWGRAEGGEGQAHVTVLITAMTGHII